MCFGCFFQHFCLRAAPLRCVVEVFGPSRQWCVGWIVGQEPSGNLRGKPEWQAAKVERMKGRMIFFWWNFSLDLKWRGDFGKRILIQWGVSFLWWDGGNELGYDEIQMQSWRGHHRRCFVGFNLHFPQSSLSSRPIPAPKGIDWRNVWNIYGPMDPLRISAFPRTHSSVASWVRWSITSEKIHNCYNWKIKTSSIRKLDIKLYTPKN